MTPATNKTNSISIILKANFCCIENDCFLAITPVTHDIRPLLTREEYVDITVKQLTYLRKEIVIHRITGDPKKEDLIAPTWLLKKFEVLNEIDKKMAKRIRLVSI